MVVLGVRGRLDDLLRTDDDEEEEDVMKLGGGWDLFLILLETSSMDCSYEGTFSLYLKIKEIFLSLVQSGSVTWLVSCTESGTFSSCPETRGVPGRELCTRRLSPAEEAGEEDPSSSSEVSA